MSEPLVCDFCTTVTSIEEGFTLPANDFTVPNMPGWGSEGGWLACAKCAGMIEKNDWPGLVEYAVSVSQTVKLLRSPDAERGLRNQLSYCYKILRENITGPLRPAEKTDMPGGAT